MRHVLKSTLIYRCSMIKFSCFFRFRQPSQIKQVWTLEFILPRIGSSSPYMNIYIYMDRSYFCKFDNIYPFPSNHHPTRRTVRKLQPKLRNCWMRCNMQRWVWPPRFGWDIWSKVDWNTMGFNTSGFQTCPSPKVIAVFIEGCQWSPWEEKQIHL